MKRNFLCYTLAASMLLTSVPAVNVYAATTNTINGLTVNQKIDEEVMVIRDYDDNEYLANVGTKRGDYQVREVIPFVLPAGESITIEQLSGTGQVDLTVELKTGLSSNDVSGTLKKDGKSLTLRAKDESVVYIKVPRTKFNDIAIEYTMTSGTTLPIYTQDSTNEGVFFQTWDQVGTNNAIIQNNDIMIQVPVINKDELRYISSNNVFNNVEHLLEYYEKMIGFYDKAYGLEGRETYNYNPAQKYLIVPELRNNGSNSVVYAEDIVRVYGSDGISKVFNDTWEVKNEIAEGYQGDMVYGDVNVDGVWNSIIAHYFSMESNSNDRTYRSNYLNSKADREEEVYEDSLDLRRSDEGEYTLDFFRNIFDEYGLEGFTGFNQEYRRLGMTDSHDDTTNTNLFAKYFSEYAEVDLVPYFVSFGHNVDESVIAATSELPKVFYLEDLVKTESYKEYLVDEYNLASEYALIDTTVFVEDRGVNLLSGDATVYLDIDNLNELTGKQVMLKNGDEEFFADIVNGRAEFNDIPLGVYNVFIPMTNSGDYIKTCDPYVIVSEDDSEVVRGKYSKINDFYINLNYDFKITTDNDDTALTANLRYLSDDNYELTINTYPNTINEASSNGVYGSIKVYDDKNRVVELVELENNKVGVEEESVLRVKKGYKIQLFRDDADNKSVTNIVTGDDINDDRLETITYEITDNGLVTDSTNVVKTVTDSYIKKGTDTFFKEKNQYFNTNYRAYLANAIDHLSESEQQSYKDSNVQNLRVNNPVLTVDNNQITVPLNANINYAAFATATDAEDGNISKLIEAKDTNVNVAKEGTYTTTLRVEDSDHNYDEATVTVVVDKNATTITGGNNGNNNTNTSNQVKPNVEIVGRQPYDVMVEKIDSENNNQFYNVTNKNTVVPYFTSSDNTKTQMKFSYFDEASDELIFLNNLNGSNFQLENKTNRFIDVSDSWAKSNIEFVSSRGIITGVTDTQFAPKGEVSRAMTVTVLGRLSDAQVSNRTSVFSDVPIATWYTGYVTWAKENNIISGVDATHFNPNDSINREQLAVALVNYLTYLGYDIEKVSTETFADDANISSWAKDSVYTLRSIGIVNGDALGNYNPKSNITRAEFSAMIERLVIFAIESEMEASSK